MIIKEVFAKSILTKSKLPEADYCINPYIGCNHGCIYCYARFMKRFTNHNEPWGDFVDIKVNAPELISKQIKRSKNKIHSVLIGSVTDAYQPVEKKYQLTRKVLIELLKEDIPVSILTKSNLITRDIDLLSQFTNCTVGLTITTTDERVRKILEPMASSIEKRIEALNILHSAKINTYAFIGPIFPLYTDLSLIFDKIHKHVNSVWGEKLNIKNRTLERLENSILRYDPDRVSEFVYLAKNENYWSTVKKAFHNLASQYNLPIKGYYEH